MKFTCSIVQRNNHRWSIRHVGADTGIIEVTAASRNEALEKMRNELRYRLELCPCTGEMYRDLQILLVEES